MDYAETGGEISYTMFICNLSAEKVADKIDWGINVM